MGRVVERTQYVSTVEGGIFYHRIECAEKLIMNIRPNQFQYGERE